MLRNECASPPADLEDIAGYEKLDGLAQRAAPDTCQGRELMLIRKFLSRRELALGDQRFDPIGNPLHQRAVVDGETVFKQPIGKTILRPYLYPGSYRMADICFVVRQVASHAHKERTLE